MERTFHGCWSLTSLPLLDTSSVTVMLGTFNTCVSLTSLPLFNTSNVTDMSYAFGNCTALKTIPLFDTSKVFQIQWAFASCTNVESGAFALYKQVSAHNTIHNATFRNCGSNTQTGAAELAQIPSSWK